jgi:hypothetical protein
MTSKKSLLNDLLDIGGVATLNNLYNPEPSTYQGAMKRIRINKDFWLAEELIEPLKPYLSYHSKFPANELFYVLTDKGAKFIGREDYKYQKAIKSPHLENIMHESAKFDVALAFLRLYRDWNVTIEYKVFPGLRPDIFIQMTKGDKTYYFLVEIERKKDLSRTIREKVKAQYESKIYNPEIRKHLPSHFKVLIVYCPLSYNSFLRPQQMTEEVTLIREDLYREVTQSRLPEKYLFMSLPDFYRLNEPVWYTSKGLTKLIY